MSNCTASEWNISRCASSFWYLGKVRRVWKY